MYEISGFATVSLTAVKTSVIKFQRWTWKKFSSWAKETVSMATLILRPTQFISFFFFSGAFISLKINYLKNISLKMIVRIAYKDEFSSIHEKI